MSRQSSNATSNKGSDLTASIYRPGEKSDAILDTLAVGPAAKPEQELAQAQEQSFSIDPANEVTGLRLLLIHLSICLCTLLVGLDFNILATAVPVITSHFDSIDDVGWYGAAFYLTLCATQPFAGKIYTLFPRKTIYLVYVAIFEAGSIVCATATSSNALIVGRAVAGIGASGLLGGGLVILTTIVPLEKRAIWQGTWSCVFSLASIVGPLIGGALTENASWRWCFFINLPVGGIAAVFFALTFRARKASTEDAPVGQKLRSLDWIGCVLFAGFIVMLLLALQWAGVRQPWNSATTIGLFVGSGLAASLFVPWQLYMGDSALIPPKLFTARNAVLICMGAFFVNGPFQTIVYWLPIWFQGVLAVSPVSSSIRYLPTVIADVLAAFISAGIVTSTGWWNPFLILGTVTMSLGGGLLTTLSPGISRGHWIGYQILVGVGYALTTNMAHLGMQASLPQHLVPIGASSVLTVISTSCAIFLAVGQAIFQDRLQTNLPASASPGLRKHFQTAGATDFRALATASELPAVITAYSKAITQVWYLPAACPVMAFVLVCFCRWISLKKDGKRSSTDDSKEGYGNRIAAEV